MNQATRYRSFFWPAVLILVGVLALLINTGLLSLERIALLVSLWPLILVVIGLELIVRRAVPAPSGNVAAALIVVIAIVAAVAYVAIAPNPAASNHLDASGEVGSLTEASAEIDAGAATIAVNGAADLGSKLYRAHVDYSGRKPTVELDEGGKLTISQGNTNFLSFPSTRFNLKLDVNPGVAWKFDVNTGSSSNTINLRHVHVSGLSVNTGASREEITLGAPSGVVPVEINGGALTVHIHRPTGTPVSAAVSGGAITFTADGKAQHGFGSASYDSPDFKNATDAYRIQVNGGACTVTIDAASLD